MFRQFLLRNSKSIFTGLSVGIGMTGGMRMMYAGDHSTSALAPAPVALSNDDWRPFKLVERDQLSHDTYKYKFELPTAGHVTGLRTSGCLGASFVPEGGERVMRPYTPTTHSSTKGSFELVIKTYPDGKMGNHLKNLKVGETVDFKGPWNKIEHVPSKVRHLTLLAGGTGVTPMYQVIQEIASNPNDTTTVKLIYLSKTEEDAFLLKDLETFARTDLRGRIEIVPRFDDKHGMLTKDELAKLIPAAPTADAHAAATAQGITVPLDMVYVCGPPGMMKAISGEKKSPADQGELSGHLSDLGWTKDRVFKF